MNRKVVYFAEVMKYNAKKGNYDVLKCFGGVYGKYNNKESFIGVLYVTCWQIESESIRGIPSHDNGDGNWGSRYSYKTLPVITLLHYYFDTINIDCYLLGPIERCRTDDLMPNCHISCVLADALWPPPSSSARSLPTPFTNDQLSGESDGALGPEPRKSADGICVNFYDDDDDDDVEEELERLPDVEHRFTSDRFLVICCFYFLFSWK